MRLSGSTMKVSTVEIWEGEGNTRNKNASYEANQEGTFTLAVNFPSPIITLYVTTEDRLGRALQIERIFRRGDVIAEWNAFCFDLYERYFRTVTKFVSIREFSEQTISLTRHPRVPNR